MLVLEQMQAVSALELAVLPVVAKVSSQVPVSLHRWEALVREQASVVETQGLALGVSAKVSVSQVFQAKLAMSAKQARPQAPILGLLEPHRHPFKLLQL
jgi:hypothetical protein